RIDFRQRLDNSVVTEGSRLVVLIAPEPGTPGVDVFGRAIPVAKPPKLRIRAGAGVHFDEATNTLTATVVGRVRMAKGVLFVDQTYAIPGSVGLKTGHVSHPGAIDISKDVEPDSQVHADGGIHIGGAIEESVVTAGGDVLVGHGIIGGDRAKVHAGGSIEAAFAERAELEAGNDIRIRRELIQCMTHTNGSLLIPEGQIIGGTASAIYGIDVAQAGSHGDVRTILITGVDPALQEMLAARHAEARACHDQIVQLSERIAPFKARQSTLTPMLRDKMDGFLAELEKVTAERDRIQHDIDRLTAESRERARAEIVIRRRVFPDTHLCIGHAKLIVAKEQEGPLVARLNDEGEVVLEPLGQQ
ncbi:MAG: DUF342 domain-containing protein, partial [Candidatus Hydrogenedentes bacterium]|nr:DUF342 domain-containing protein [Candidatus Hydrogenedentota bacterium]